MLQAFFRATEATQTAIAEQTGLSQSTVSRLMAGRSGGQTIETAIKLLDGLGAPRQLAGLQPKGLAHFTREAGGPDPALDQGSKAPVRRRDFGQKILLAGLAIPIVGKAHEPARHGPIDVVKGLDRTSDVVADLWALDAVYGGAALADLAETRLQSIERQLKHVILRPSDEPIVEAVIGHIATAAAWFSYEGGDLKRAKRLLKEALYAAHQSGDVALKLLVINNLCLAANAGGDPARMATLASDALELAPRANPQLSALLSMRASLGKAGVGQEREFTQQRGAAWRLLDKAPSAPTDEWFKFFGEEEMNGLDAMGLQLLADHAETPAEKREKYGLAAQRLSGVTGQMAPRNRAYYQVIQAITEAQAGEVRTGVETFHRALPLVLEVTSQRINSKITDFARALSGVADDDAIEARTIALSLVGGR